MAKNYQGPYFLDKVSPRDIRLQPQLHQAISDYHWELYSFNRCLVVHSHYYGLEAAIDF